MELGFENLRDILDVLLVPVAVGLLALLWPAFAARKRRLNFEYLIRRELEEAAPETEDLPRDVRWHKHLAKHFLHEEIISHPVDNSEFVLSLNPRLAYSLSQMWIAFKEGSKKGNDPSRHEAEQWCWYLRETCEFLDRRSRWSLRQQLRRRWNALWGHPDKDPFLIERVWKPWRDLVKIEYADGKVDDTRSSPDSDRAST
jgi:hypothetical protein